MKYDDYSHDECPAIVKQIAAQSENDSARNLVSSDANRFRNDHPKVSTPSDMNHGKGGES